MRSVASCSELTGKKEPFQFKVGEVYRIVDRYHPTYPTRSALVIAGFNGKSGQGYIIDKGDTSYPIATITLDETLKPIHLPKAVIVTGE